MICKHFVDNILKRALVLCCTQLNGFQVFLCNSYNLISVICLHTVHSILSIYRTLSVAATVGQSGLGSDFNVGILNIPQIFKAGASP